MKIDFEGRAWQFEMDEVTVKQGEVIAAYTGLSLSAWYRSLLDPDSLGWLKSMQCLYWLIREQNGEGIPLESADFAPLKLMAAFNDAAGAETSAEAEEDPTRPGGEPAVKAQPMPAASLSG